MCTFSPCNLTVFDIIPTLQVAVTKYFCQKVVFLLYHSVSTLEDYGSVPLRDLSTYLG